MPAVVYPKPRVYEAQDVEFDLQAGYQLAPGSAELGEGSSQEVSRREPYRGTIGEIDVAEHPSRLWQPRQQAERRGIRHHDHIARALQLRKSQTCAGREHGNDGAMR